MGTYTNEHEADGYLTGLGFSKREINAAVTELKGIHEESGLELTLPHMKLADIVEQEIQKGNDPRESLQFFVTKTSEMELTPLSEIEETAVEWLISGRVPKGEVCLFAGDGGVGKTAAVCDLIASVTRGRPSLLDADSILPEEWETREPGKVLFFSSEDDFSKVLVGRLRRCQADLTKVFTVQITDDGFNDIYFGSPKLEQYIAGTRPVLCVFDPLQSFLPPGVNMSARNEMRKSMNPLIELGRTYGTTFIVLVHTNKKKGVSGRSRVADSSDLWDITRSVLMFGRADDNGNYYISHEKCNYGKLAPTLIFDIMDGGVARFKSTANKKDRDFVAESEERKRSSPVLDEAKEFILGSLRNERQMKVSDLEALAMASGFAPKTIRNAKAQLRDEGIVKFSNMGFGKEKLHWISLEN